VLDSCNNLNIVLGKLLRQGSPTACKRIDGIVDSDLAILMIEPGINIFTALLQDLLTKHDRRSGSIDEEVVVWHIHIKAQGSATIVT